MEVLTPTAGPFVLLPTREKGKGRALILDPRRTDLSAGTDEEVDLRLYKTTNRNIYDQATARGSKSILSSRPNARYGRNVILTI